MIKGVGTDIIEIDRIQANVDQYGESFLSRILTEKEKEYCLSYKQSAPIVAGRFAAKEAIVKALGTGFGEPIGFHDIEIINDAHGKPQVFLSEKSNKHFNSPNIYLSISHCKSHAIAFALFL